MDWKPEEDIVCCEICVYEYVIKKNATDINSCIEKIKLHSSIWQRDSGSIRNRIQNIKAYLGELKVENTIPIAPLSNTAKQTEKILITCLKNAGYLKSLSGNV